MCAQLNVRATARDNTGRNLEGTHPVVGWKLKIMTPPGIEPGRAGLESRDFTDHATTTDYGDY